MLNSVFGRNKSDAKKLGEAVKEVLPALRDLDDDTLIGEIYDQLYPQTRALPHPRRHLDGVLEKSRNYQGKWYQNWFEKGRSENRVDWLT